MYDAYFKVWQIRSQIQYTKLNSGRMVAEYNDKRQFVRRKLGIAGKMETVIDFVGAKAGLLGAEMSYQIDARLTDTILDQD